VLASTAAPAAAEAPRRMKRLRELARGPPPPAPSCRSSIVVLLPPILPDIGAQDGGRAGLVVLGP